MRVDPGTVIELASCRNCGRGVLVKANKNGIAYYYCNGKGSDDGAGCSHHEKWGRAASQEKIRAYHQAQKEGTKDDHTGQPEAGGEAGAEDQVKAGQLGGDEAGADEAGGKKPGGLAGFFDWT